MDSKLHPVSTHKHYYYYYSHNLSQNARYKTCAQARLRLA